MWCESQNCAMMGLQATTGKRKLEAATAPGDSSPAKNGRWEADDCIARLQAVAVPSDAWKAATLLSDDFEDDEDFEDDLSDDDRCGPNGINGSSMPETARFSPHMHQHHQQHIAPPPQQQPPPQTLYPPTPPPVSAANRYQASAADYWQYYQPPQQQTIRCEENGKSYLELGAAPPVMARCCDGRTRWCHVPCYRQRRLAVLNLSMCKLARYRQCSDPSLRRSVLICNTLRRLEHEMESEPPEPTYHHHPHPTLPELAPPSRLNPVPEQQPASVPPPPSSSLSSAVGAASSANSSLAPTSSYEHSLREMTASSGRATPFPPPPSVDADSGIGDDDATRPINWGSVLSLTSQTDLESLNNNELYAELGLTSDFEWNKDSGGGAVRAENEWEGFMHVLVGSS